jgi:tetratricopeptide (TPR) repeat protein
MTIRTLRLSLTSLIALACFLLLASPASAQVIARIEGTAVDEAGIPVEGVEVSLKRLDTNAMLKPAKTGKKGTYLYMVEPGDYIMIAKKAGYMIVRQLSDISNSDGVRSNLTYFFDEKQEFNKKVHVYATGDLTSKSKNKIDWVVTVPDRFTATVNKLVDEYRGVTADKAAKPAQPGKPAPAAPVEEKRPPYELAIGKIADKDYAGAIPLLRETVEKTPDDPNNADAWYQLGKALMEADSGAEPASGLDKPGAPDPNRPDNVKDAETALKQAKKLDPTKPGVSFYIAKVFTKKGRKIQAVQALEEERALSPDSEAVLDSLAVLYSDTGQPEKAIDLYESMIAKNPDDFDAYTSLAALYKEKGDKAKEEEVYTKLGDRDPTGKSLYNLGNLAFNRNEADKASIYYKKVLEKDPNHAMAHFQLAYTLVNLGDFPGAVSHFEAFLKLNPKDAKAGEAKKMVEELKKISPPGAKSATKS